MALRPIEVTLMRGGTSKGVFIRLPELPPAGVVRDALVLGLLGSPDPMQLDGLGGAQSATSKLMAVGTVQEARAAGYEIPPVDAEIAYVFAQVGVAEASIDWKSNCGNLASAVGPYSILQGLVQAVGPSTMVRMLNLNLGVVIEAVVPVEGGMPAFEGDFVMPGVPGSGACIDLRFRELTEVGERRPVFPTGNRVETLTVRSRDFEVSIVDMGNPLILVAAESLGLCGTELPAELNADAGLLGLLESIRRAGAVRLGLAHDLESAAVESVAGLRVALLAGPQDHRCVAGLIAAADCDLVARMTSMGMVHHAFAATGLASVAVAVAIDGTVARRLARREATSSVRLAHPKGVVAVGSDVSDGGAQPTVRYVQLGRSARRLMTGVAYAKVPARLLPEAESAAMTSRYDGFGR